MDLRPAPETSPPETALRSDFLRGMSFAACTVNVITTDGAAGRHGVTVSAMSSVSADTPRPTLLVCIHEKSASAPAILKNGVFCVNVLRDDQAHISDCFAGRIRTASGDKFDCAEWTTVKTGAPRVKDPLVAFDCRVVLSQRIGTHHVFFGEVEAIFSASAGSPLIYANRAYGTPRSFEPAALPPPTSPTPAAASNRIERRGGLKLGVFNGFGPYIVPQVLARLTALGQEPRLRLVEGDQKRVADSLEVGEIDLALLYDFGVPASFETEKLAQLPPHVVLAAHHPLANHAALSLAELAAEPMILLDAFPSGAYFLSLFAKAGLQPQVRFRSSSMEMVRGMVGKGLGYALLATKPASPMTYDGSALVTRPLADAVEATWIVLAARPGGFASEPAQPFIRECRSLFGR